MEDEMPPDVTANPFDDWLSFQEQQLVERHDREFSGRMWTVDLELLLPRAIVHNSLRAQLELAGFVLESEPGNRGLVRFFREDSYVWGVISDRRGGGSIVSLALTRLRDESPEET